MWSRSLSQSRKSLDDFLKVVLKKSKTDVHSRLQKAGFTPEELSELCLAPGTDIRIIDAAIRAHVYPVLPEIVLQMAQSAAGGNERAAQSIIGLLSSKGPLADQLGDLGKLTDEELDAKMDVLMEQLKASRTRLRD